MVHSGTSVTYVSERTDGPALAKLQRLVDNLSDGWRHPIGASNTQKLLYNPRALPMRFGVDSERRPERLRLAL
jgi:hypothetical protein